MKKERLLELKDRNSTAASELRSFTTGAAYALIAASWAVMSHSSSSSNWLVLAILSAIIFLAIKGFRLWLNLMHFNKVWDDIDQKKKKYPDSGRQRTCYGQLSTCLDSFYYIILIFSLFLFVVGTCKLIESSNSEARNPSSTAESNHALPEIVR